MRDKRIIEDVVSRSRSLSIYDVGETIEGLASKIKRKPCEILKLNSNENFFIPLEFIRGILRQVVEEVDPRIYPRDEFRELKGALSEVIGVSSENIIIGAGSDQLIDLVSKIFLKDGDEAISIEPTFSIYERCVRIQNANYRTVLLKDDFSLDADAILSSITPKTKVIFLCSPNNPTANQLDYGDILKIAERFDGLVAVDEAYADFASSSLINVASSLENLIVFRTFSKVFGLAGLRVGYATANKRLSKVIDERFQMPYTVSIMALRAAVKMLENMDYIREKINAVKFERTRLIERLNEMKGVRAFPSETNFVLFQVNRSSSAVYKGLLDRGVIVRDIGRVLGFENCLRVTVAPRHYMDRFITELREVLCEVCL
ncbi:MAG: histidinol-phosphate transaminase, partial [Candidatus Bathyarchaeota archaeon]|nr:histidinol-phosphate transaminase [Candidatus Bathyarchaeota archaeon]